MTEDERFMTAALAYGHRGFGLTAPNPCVAALVVRDGVVIGRGVTAPGGRPHAETQAIAQAGEAARGATIYVTLEPCSHHGHTAPCTQAIIEAGLARVVAAAGDPDPRVSGRGFDQLRAAGIGVAPEVCAETARRDHRGHISRVRTGRPMVTLKLAETADGFAAAPSGAPRLMITGPMANDWTHMARATHDAVLIGAGTARADDPLLTVRLPGMDHRQPTRIVLDPQARLSPASRLAASAATSPVVIVTSTEADPARLQLLREAGADVLQTASGQGGLDLRETLQMLGARGFTRLFCEGGPHLATALLEADLVDDFVLLTGADALGRDGLPVLASGTRATVMSAFRLAEDRKLGRDRLRRFEKDHF